MKTVGTTMTQKIRTLQLSPGI